MKTPLILTLLLLGALAAVPGGQAQPASPADAETCVTVYDFPDLGYRLCVDPADRQCTIYEYRTTIVGTEKTCLFPPLAATSQAVGPGSWPTCVPAAVGQLCFSPYWPGCNLWVVWTAIPMQPTCLYRSEPGPLAAESAGGPPPCYEVYSETHLAGPYWLVRRNSCSAQLYQCPDGYSPPAPPCEEVGLEAQAAVSQEPMCMYYYHEHEVGPVRHVQRDSCHSETYVCGEQARGFVDGLLATGDAGPAVACAEATLDDPAAASPPQRVCHTQGQGELQSRTCVDPNSTDCTVYRQQITGMGSSWVCYPSGESGSDW